MSFHQLIKTQKVPADLDTVWAFISRPENLKAITPPYMGFDIRTPNLPEIMYPGMIVHYKVSPVAGIKLSWVSEISHIREKAYFVDEQRSGPYAMWHHEHAIEAIEGGVLMTDIISYKLPLGPLGDLAHWLFVRRQLEGIFAYRKQALDRIFGEFK